MEFSDEHEEAAKRRLGTVLRGKYTVDRVLGAGGMAVVYAATHRNRKKVAIKMLHAELSVHEDIRRRFLREGYVANTVKHRGAVDILDDDVAENGAAFLVMELLDGAPVDRLAAERGGVLGIVESITIAHGLCDVLAAAHVAAVVHRDIKPANLFVTRDGELKVLDFGIARLRDPSARQNDTHTGVTMGTPAFMAPEQALGNADAIGPTTDVWATGATLFSLLTGANVHPGDNFQQVVIRAATKPARSLGDVAPGMPTELVHVVDRALAFEPAARWESMPAFREALAACHEALFGGPVSSDALEALVTDGAAAAEGLVNLPTEPAPPRPAPLFPTEAATWAAANEPVATARATTHSVRLSRVDALPRAILGSGRILVGLGLFAVVAAGGWWQLARRARGGTETSTPIAAAASSPSLASPPSLAPPPSLPPPRPTSSVDLPANAVPPPSVGAVEPAASRTTRQTTATAPTAARPYDAGTSAPVARPTVFVAPPKEPRSRSGVPAEPASVPIDPASVR